MKHLTHSFLFWLFMAFSSLPKASAQHQPADLPGLRSANALILARLIKEHAYFNGGTMVFRYDTHVTTTAGLKLYISQQAYILGGTSDPDWYYLDLEQPITADDLKLIRGKKGYFLVEASRRITRKVKTKVRNGQLQQRERNARLFIFFYAGMKKRTTDYDQLQHEFSEAIGELVQYQ